MEIIKVLLIGHELDPKILGFRLTSKEKAKHGFSLSLGSLLFGKV